MFPGTHSLAASQIYLLGRMAGPTFNLLNCWHLIGLIRSGVLVKIVVGERNRVG